LNDLKSNIQVSVLAGRALCCVPANRDSEQQNLAFLPSDRATKPCFFLPPAPESDSDFRREPENSDAFAAVKPT
jgi:hypothetical protein